MSLQDSFKCIGWLNGSTLCTVTDDARSDQPFSTKPNPNNHSIISWHHFSRPSLVIGFVWASVRCPEVTLCGWQDVTFQLLTELLWPPRVTIYVSKSMYMFYTLVFCCFFIEPSILPTNRPKEKDGRNPERFGQSEHRSCRTTFKLQPIEATDDRELSRPPTG